MTARLAFHFAPQYPVSGACFSRHAERAHVQEPANAGRSRRGDDVARSSDDDLVELLRRAFEDRDEIDRGVDAVHRLLDGRRVGDVAARRARERPNGVAVGLEPADDGRADVPGRAGHEHLHGVKFR